MELDTVIIGFVMFIMGYFIDTPYLSISGIIVSITGLLF